MDVHSPTEATARQLCSDSVQGARLAGNPPYQASISKIKLYDEKSEANLHRPPKLSDGVILKAAAVRRQSVRKALLRTMCTVSRSIFA